MSLIDRRLGVAEVSLTCWELLQDNLPAALAAEELKARAMDARYAAKGGRGLVLGQFTLETLIPERIHWGHKPTLIESPVEEWPAVAVMAFQSVPSPNNADIDQAESSRISISMEFIVKSDFFPEGDRSNDGETQVNRRAMAYAEAIHDVMISNHEVIAQSGFTAPDSPPSVTWGEVFAGNKSDGMGDRVYWQGARFQYAFDKLSAFGGIDQRPY